MKNIYKGDIEGLVVIEPKIFVDNRGYFFESYQKEDYKKLGIYSNFIQDNESKSTKGVLRGLHLQSDIHAQAKLVRVVQGSVWDVAVDVRPDSKTYGKWFGIELNEKNKLQFFIPRGLAHGFVVLSDTCIFQYKCDNLYNKSSEKGIYYNSDELNIEWPKLNINFSLSEKDLKNPSFSEFTKNIK